jgi:hypothetical protein
MRRFSQLAFLAFFLASCAPAQPPMPKLTYPSPRKGDVVEDYHGTKVADPYRWMEDLDIDRRTLVIFTSDNGPWLPFRTHGGSSGPLKEGKGTTWEGAHAAVVVRSRGRSW